MTSDPAADPASARQRLAAVAAMSALVVHSGRNRLTVARTALELLQARMEADLTDEQRASFLQQLDLFLHEFNLGAELVRCHASTPEAVSIRQAATDALETMRASAQRAGVALTSEYSDGPDRVKAAPGLVRVTLLNVLRNAIEALAGSPPADGAPARIHLRVAAAGPRCQLEVADNGPGVPEEIRDRLFRDFVTGKSGSAGLGLSFCRDAMTVMGGSIAHLTPRGKPGARFRLEFDLWRD